MPPGYILLVSCFLVISVVNARKSERESYKNDWQVTNTMSREADESHAPARYPDTIDIDNNQGYSMSSDYPGSGYGQRDDEWGSGFTDDEDGYDDFSGGYRESEYPPVIPKPNKRPGVGSDRDDTFIVKPPKHDRPTDESHEPDNGIIYDGPKQPESEADKPGIVIETVPEGDDEVTDEDDDDDHSDEHLSRSIIQTPGLLPGIIGGAVVGLLCAVLLVMFIVYRMRKKDEGSYALEEPKMTSPSRGYTRAPTKEYWA